MPGWEVPAFARFQPNTMIFFSFFAGWPIKLGRVHCPVSVAAPHRSGGFLVRPLVLAVCLLLATAGCATARAGRAASAARRGSSSAPVYGPEPQPQPELTPHLGNTCLPATGFTCTMWGRISQVKHYLATRPGQVGVVLHDRATDATWVSKDGDTDFPAASTIKLAMVTDLMRRVNDGSLSLGPGDWDLINQILYDSDDAAGDTLWSAFEDPGFLARIKRFGMRTAYYSSSTPYWGFMYCSAHDLDNLMDYDLGKLPAHDAAYIAHRMRRVGPIERWGVWGAGSASHPGDKDGWENEGGVWITNTVGFAGPHAEYTLAIMDNLDGAGGFHGGSTTLNEVASILFQGHQTAAPTAEATPEAGEPTPY
jgi:beta-lactamase family protein